MSASTEFRRCIKPLVLMNSIFVTGLTEYFIEKKINAIGIIYGLFSIIIYITMANVFSFPSEDFQADQPELVQITHKLYVYSDYIFQIFTIIAGIIRRKKIRRFTVQLGTCIQTMAQLNIPIKYSYYFRQQCYLILFLILSVIIMAIVDYRWFKLFVNDFSSIVTTLYVERYPFVILSIIDATFVYWITYIKTRFGQLNEVLKNMLTTTIDSPQHKRVFRMKNNKNNNSSSNDIHRMYKSNDDLIKIKKIREIHLELIKCARNANDAYGLHMLMSISTAFVLITTVSYNLYLHIITGAYRTQGVQNFVFLFWLGYFGIKIIFISHACEETVKEIRDFTLQLLQNPLSFTGCAVFYLDHTLIRNVISSVTTYLVILIQVGNVPPSVIAANLESSTNDPS